MLWHSVDDKQFRQCVNHVIRPDPSRHLDGHALSSEFIDHRKHPDSTPVLGPTCHEIVCPHVTFSLRFQPDDRTVIQPEPASLRLLLRHFQPFSSPDALYTLVINLPSLITEQRCDPAISVPSEPYCQLDDVGGQRFFIIQGLQGSALCRSMLVEHPTGSAFRHSR